MSDIMPLKHAMDHFVATALIRFRQRVEILSAFDLLIYSGDDWPQPHPAAGMKRLPWEDFPSKDELIILRDRIKEHTHEGQVTHGDS